MKYVDTKVVFREVPEEVTLAINISGCPVRCPGCHSSYLVRDVGEILDAVSLKSLIDSNKGISCVSFMGGDADPSYIRDLAVWVRSNYPGLKTSWYSGRSLEQAGDVIPELDFIKVGPFIDEFGPLDKETTNQRFYRVRHGSRGDELEDWTARFRKRVF
ncbi:MAG: anaerobic ribonucleoside-triphosphate reductase activating protein [Bacteroidales bacterium]|nr:anaerobic ribonucleoside-triphosphate reductase activating protein [Bacteroidales bacterium]